MFCFGQRLRLYLTYWCKSMFSTREVTLISLNMAIALANVRLQAKLKAIDSVGSKLTLQEITEMECKAYREFHTEIINASETINGEAAKRGG